MSDNLPEGKKQIALDIDWQSAALSLIFFVFMLLAAYGTARRVVARSAVETQVTWVTIIYFLLSAWGAAITRNRIVKYACGLFCFGIAIRIILRLAHASDTVQVFNAEVLRVIYLVIMIGLCVSIPLWFKRLIKHV